LHAGSGKKDKTYSSKKIALKKIVANMTMSNNDMIALFADVIMCMEIPNLEIKKMYVGTEDTREATGLFVDGES
jgi:vesicle coat complex subunit